MKEESIEEFISRHEGRRNKPYKCLAGKNTIGVGWNFDANPLPAYIQEYLDAHGEITDNMIDYLLGMSTIKAMLDCEKLFPDFHSFSDNRRKALIDFIFQLGLAGARKFVHTIAAINTGRWDDAAKGIRNSAYAKQVPSRCKEVTDLIEEG